MAQKLIEGINNHDRLSQYIFNKFEKRSPLSQLQKRYNVGSAKPLLSVNLPPSYDPLDRPGSQASTIASRDGRNGSRYNMESYKPALIRNKSTPVWLGVPQHDDMQELCSLSETPSPRRVVFSTPRRTASSRLPNNKRRSGKGRVGGRSADVIYTIRQNPTLSKEDIQVYTSLIREQWDSVNRQYIRTGVYARGRPEAKDQEIAQWFTFDGGNFPGAIDAFVYDMATENPRYSVEASVGKIIATKLTPDASVKICNNGDLIHDDDAMSTYSGDFYTRCNKIIRMARSNDAKHDPVETPLSMSDVEKEARVVVPRSGRDSFRSELNQNTSMPVIFNSHPVIKPYIPPDGKSDEARLTKLLSHKASPPSPQPDERDVTYEEILELHAPTSKATQKTDPVTRHQVTPRPTRTAKKQKSALQQRSQSAVEYDRARLRTPTIPDDLRQTIESQRQCTVRVYSHLPSQPDKEQNTVLSPKLSSGRVGTPIRPPRYVPVYNTDRGSTATSIPSSGVTGERQFIKITNSLGSAEVVDDKFDKDVVRAATAVGVVAVREPPVRQNPGVRKSDVTSVTLVGKAPPVELVTRSAVSHVKVPQNSAKTTTSQVVLPSAVEEVSTVPEAPVNKFDVSIPIADMISASSAAVNSIDDFIEFDAIDTKELQESTTLD